MIQNMHNSQSLLDPIINKGSREFHDTKGSTYWLPKDTEERQRLIRQHRPVKALFGGNIPSKIANDMSATLNNGGIIVDLCCGPGNFILEVAAEYPKSTCIGIDMVDIFAYDEDLKNVSFQYGNLLQGLPFEDNSIDLISMNYCIFVCKREQWVPVLKEIKRVLKPGGYFLSKEPGQLDVGDDFVKLAGSQYLARTISAGQVPHIRLEMKDFLVEAGFEDVESIQRTLYPGQPGQINEDYLANLCGVFKSMLPNIADGLNLTPDKYDDFINQLHDHLNKPETEYSIGMNYGKKPF